MTTVNLDALAYGQRLKVLRIAGGLKQQDIAQAAGLHQSAVSRVERLQALPDGGFALEAARKVERVLTGAEGAE